MSVIGRTLRLIAGAIFAASILVPIAPNTASAQQTQPPTAKAFLVNPQQLLQQYPNGGQLLIKAVQQLALEDPSTFKVLIGLLKDANDLQRGAIGEGLAQATKLEVLADQALATEWQQEIVAITDPTFKTAALNAFGDVTIGAVGATPLGGQLGGFGTDQQGSNGSSVVQDIRSKTVNTQSFVFTTTPIFGTTPSNSVSP